MFICARDVHENCRNRVLKSGWHVPNIYRFYDIINANSSTNIGCAIPPTLMKLRQIFLHIHARLHNEHFYHGHCLLGMFSEGSKNLTNVTFCCVTFKHRT
jgi:hypothetical protein